MITKEMEKDLRDYLSSIAVIVGRSHDTRLVEWFFNCCVELGKVFSHGNSTTT